MSFRPDAPAFTRPTLFTGSPIVTLSTATAPSKDNDGGTLAVGQTWVHEDTGGWFYWTGAAWLPAQWDQAEGLKLSLLFEIRDLLQTQVSDDE